MEEDEDEKDEDEEEVFSFFQGRPLFFCCLFCVRVYAFVAHVTLFVQFEGLSVYLLFYYSLYFHIISDFLQFLLLHIFLFDFLSVTSSVKNSCAF